MRQRIFTLRQIIKAGTERLEAAGIDEAALDAWYLLEYVTGISRAAYYGEPKRELGEEQARRYLECIERRKKRIPLQHITGEQEFMGYPFYVNEHVLIPRQDTETLVEEAVKLISGRRKRGTKVLDMCTGSGCILLSILKMCPEAEGVGCDISKEALAVAERNAKRLGVIAKWVRSDLFREFTQNPHIEKYDMIVSNPPYIRTSDIEGLQEEVRFHDPQIALDGGEDGFVFYRKIIKDSISYIEDGGCLLFEIGCDQGEEVAALMEEYGYEDVRVKKDLAGLERIVSGRYNRGRICEKRKK